MITHYFPDRQATGVWFEQLSRILLCLLILAILGSIVSGIIRALIDVEQALLALGPGPASPVGNRAVLIDVLGVLAMMEVFRTAMTYLVEGKVKVTYIIDTVLVALLTELLAFWYHEVDLARVAMLLALVVVLMVLRILAIRFSPNRRALCDGL
ncbi:phosphate-starvation-inducible PsiE family protein [Desulfuromonas carbonis]|uniref:phosphate-starvation-inducible PsiE family protein n=1 Tax=Desulfuromonas sp. DDH964 TaxID=1823759 RepID=UPI00078E8E87|nr:phosphate-starvation-inducible PsiE family protein [Desulfuromonas sp. DDH964]AMV73707.1 hypothetical protein DBW_3409 [Desulfuromonas sp. DDH964]